jgi:hypothetical protein
MELKRKLAFDVCVNLGLGEHSFDSVYLNMWRNIREDGGFRLTDHGFQWLSEMGIKSHLITLPNQGNTLLEIKTGNVLLGLDRHLKAPYFIKNNRLSIFDDSISTQLLLYGGDIKAYIDANS